MRHERAEGFRVLSGSLITTLRRSLSPSVLALSVAACGSGAAVAPGAVVALTPGGSPAAHAHGAGHDLVQRFQHIVIVVQENRTIDNLFNGFPGANTVTQGRDSHGEYVQLEPVDLNSIYNVEHTHPSFELEYDNGLLDGFNLAKVHGIDGQKYKGGPYFAYSYVPQNEVQPYWEIASLYALSDNTFQSNNGPSFPGHLYLVAGQSGWVSENPDHTPWGCDAPPRTHVITMDPNNGKEDGRIFPCLDQTRIARTLADELDSRGLSWRYYTPALEANFGQNWNAFDAISAIRYSNYWTTNVISPETNFLTDVQNGTLANVTWVIPAAANSDHDGVDTLNGPSWVASVVNAVGQSKFWSSTAIIVTWDDWGGWYDHVPPPQLDYMGLGFRVPLLMVSPYTQPGTLSHVQHESASILKFVETTFALAPLSGADARASNLTDLVTGTSARKFQQIHTSVSPREVVRRALADHKPVDDE
jgi:phospholipase C